MPSQDEIWRLSIAADAPLQVCSCEMRAAAFKASALDNLTFALRDLSKLRAGMLEGGVTSMAVMADSTIADIRQLLLFVESHSKWWAFREHVLHNKAVMSDADALLAAGRIVGQKIHRSLKRARTV